MGYRSDVVYVAEFPSELDRAAAWAAAQLKYELSEYYWEHFDNFEKNAIYFYADAVKWYDSYPEVAGVDMMFKEFWHTDFDANVKVVIIGEELEDTTEETYECESGRSNPDWFWDLSVERHISTPF